MLVLLTKADKLASGARKAQLNMVREAVLALSLIHISAGQLTDCRRGSSRSADNPSGYMLSGVVIR